MIKIEGVEIKYGDFVAMKTLDLHIKEGEFFTLLGPSGCGKTTLLRSISGFVQPSKGKIYLDGKDVTDVVVEKREVGIVFQSYAIFPTMNVYENIAFGLRVKKLPEKEIKKQVLEIANMVDLTEEMLYRKATQLSGGQQQRVAIARSLIMKPKILCLDEPLSNLDAKLRHQLRIELKKIQQKFKITTVYVTHDQEEALTLSDRIAVFNHGILQQVGTPNEIYHSPKTKFIADFIGDINQYNLEQVNALVQKSPFALEDSSYYIKLNSFQQTPFTDSIELKCTLENVEFFGLFTKLTYYFNDNIRVKIIDISSKKTYRIGSEQNLYFHLDDVIVL